MVVRISILLLIVAAVGSADVPPSTSQQSFNGYPPSGWRPSGSVFSLPERPSLPQNINGATQMNPRSLKYGPPQFSQVGGNSKELENGQHNPLQNGQFPRNSFEGSGAGENENQSDGFQLNTFYGAPSVVQDNRLKNVDDGPNTDFSPSNVYQNTQYDIRTPNQIDLTYFPQDTIAVPPNEPPVTYGPPEALTTTAATTTEADLTTTELPTTTTTTTIEDDESISVKTSEKIIEKENLEEVDSASGEEGIYYIYHPNGVLQKVSYLTKDDQSNMAYSAQLKYETVEPIKSPVYTYDAETFVFKRLYK